MKKIATALSYFLLLNTIRVFSQGQHDISFDGDGRTLTSFSTLNCYGRCVAVQEDGKILVGGYTTNDDFTLDYAIVRYNNDGSPDNSFDGDGKVTTDLSNVSSDYAKAIALGTDGKIVVVGYSLINFNFDFSLARYNSDGSLDANFGNGGIVNTTIGVYDDIANAVAIESDGSIIVAGSTSNGATTDIAVARYLSNGSPDTTFGTNGIVITDFSGTNDIGYALAVQSDGKILVAGSTFVSTVDRFALVRYNSNGTPDNTFSTDGLVTATLLGPDKAYAMALQGDGKIVLAGSTHQITERFALARFNTDGSLDTTFSTDGYTTNTFTGNANAIGYGVVIQPDGKIIEAGVSGYSPDQKFSVLRVNTNGSLDNTFSSDGKTTTDIGNGPDNGTGVALQPDGKIVVAGFSEDSTTMHFSVARYISGLNVGVVDFSWKENSVLIYPNPIENQAQLEYKLSSAEKLSLELFDASGKKVQSFFIHDKRNAGIHHEVLNLNSMLPAGNYVLVLSNGKKQLSVKIIKQ